MGRIYNEHHNHLKSTEPQPGSTGTPSWQRFPRKNHGSKYPEWQRKMHCLRHLRKLACSKPRNLTQLSGLWPLRVTCSAWTQRWFKAHFHEILFSSESLSICRGGHRLHFTTSAPWRQHASQSTLVHMPTRQHLVLIILPLTPSFQISPPTTGSRPIMQQATGSKLSCQS